MGTPVTLSSSLSPPASIARTRKRALYKMEGSGEGREGEQEGRRKGRGREGEKEGGRRNIWNIKNVRERGEELNYIFKNVSSFLTFFLYMLMLNSSKSHPAHYKMMVVTKIYETWFLYMCKQV